MRTVLSLVLFVNLVGCAGLMPLQQPHYAPQSLTLTLPVAPDRAYVQAYKAFAKMPGGTVTTADASMHALTGDINHVVRLTVAIEAQGAGSFVTINGWVIPGQLVSGTFNEVERYAQLLKESN